MANLPSGASAAVTELQPSPQSKQGRCQHNDPDRHSHDKRYGFQHRITKTTEAKAEAKNLLVRIRVHASVSGSRVVELDVRAVCAYVQAHAAITLL